MAIDINTYEDWGPISNNRGTNRSLVTNANLKTIADPNQHYYLNDLTRPILIDNTNPQYTCTFTRYLSFQISGTYARVKNIRIKIPAGFLSNNWRVMYGLTSTYTAPVGTVDQFGRPQGVFAGNLNTLTEEITLYPMLSTAGPENAVDRQIYGSNQTVWTQYLVLQFMAHQSVFDDVDNFGTESIEVFADELEI